MKKFTAVYSTKEIKNINYSFVANSISEAKEYCKRKFTEVVYLLIEHEACIDTRHYINTEELREKAILNIDGNEKDHNFLDKNVFVLKTRQDLSTKERTVYKSESHGIYTNIDRALIEAQESGYFDRYNTDVIVVSVELDRAIMF